MDTPPSTVAKRTHEEDESSNITLQRRHALRTIYAPGQESRLSALVTGSSLQSSGNPASQATTDEETRRLHDDPLQR